MTCVPERVILLSSVNWPDVWSGWRGSELSGIQYVPRRAKRALRSRSGDDDAAVPELLSSSSQHSVGQGQGDRVLVASWCCAWLRRHLAIYGQILYRPGAHAADTVDLVAPPAAQVGRVAIEFVA